jgi:hypothetical protein
LGALNWRGRGGGCFFTDCVVTASVLWCFTVAGMLCVIAAAAAAAAAVVVVAVLTVFAVMSEAVVVVVVVVEAVQAVVVFDGCPIGS